MSALPLELASLVIDVVGEPVAQGSMIPVQRGKKWFVVPDNATKLKHWRDAIAKATRARAALEHWQPLDGPIELTVWFFMTRPPSVTREYPTVPPDGDKCQRAVADALKVGGAIVDDARIVDWHAYQRYALKTAGARITVRPL